MLVGIEIFTDFFLHCAERIAVCVGCFLGVGNRAQGKKQLNAKRLLCTFLLIFKCIKMKVLIACEESQTITAKYRKNGIEAYSCDKARQLVYGSKTCQN